MAIDLSPAREAWWKAFCEGLAAARVIERGEGCLQRWDIGFRRAMIESSK